MALKDVTDKIKSKVKASVDYLTEPHYSKDQKKLFDLKRQIDTSDKASIDAGSGKNNPDEWEKTRALRNELSGDYNKQWEKTYHPMEYYSAHPEDLKEDAKDMKKGGTVKSSSASKRADGCAIRGKTRA
jgi:hypothetical protein